MILSVSLVIFEILLFVSMVLCLGRIAIGPTAADRMVAVDLLGLLVAVLMISHAIRSGDEAILDIVVVFSVIAFFGTVGLAHYLQRESDPTPKP
jgi:multicomponent Na+:H+ antiporter subunit F